MQKKISAVTFRFERVENGTFLYDSPLFFKHSSQNISDFQVTKLYLELSLCLLLGMLPLEAAELAPTLNISGRTSPFTPCYGDLLNLKTFSNILKLAFLERGRVHSTVITLWSANNLLENSCKMACLSHDAVTTIHYEELRPC